MKYLIAISSCETFETNGCNQAMRDTWLQDVPKHEGLDYRFFVGYGVNGIDLHEGYPKNCRELLPDVVQVDCLDHYGHLTYKTQASLRWAFEEGYEFVFRCFPDTYVRLDRLMKSGFRGHDYHGDFRRECLEAFALNYASGGAGYWLSKNAYRHLLDAPILGVWRDELMTYVEDMWVGNILGRARQKGYHLVYFDDRRFITRGQANWPNLGNDLITAHLSIGPIRDMAYLMRAAHAEWRIN